MTKTIGDEIREAVQSNDAEHAGKIADVLRFRRGMTYNQIRDFFAEVSGISANNFEHLMYLADEIEVAPC